VSDTARLQCSFRSLTSEAQIKINKSTLIFLSIRIIARTQQHQQHTPKVTAACRLALPIVRSLLHFIFNEHFSHSLLYATFACVVQSLRAFCTSRLLRRHFLRAIKHDQHRRTFCAITALKPTPVLTAHRTLGLFCIWEESLRTYYCSLFASQSSTLHRRGRSSRFCQVFRQSRFRPPNRQFFYFLHSS